MLSLVLFVPGCNLNDVDYPSTLTPEMALTDEASVYPVMNGVFYEKFTTYRSNFQYLMIGMSDMFVASNRAEVEAILSKQRILNNNGQLSWIWTKNYSTIQGANNLIESVAGISMSEETRNMFVGECQFLRGWAYYELTRLWGRIPIRNEVVYSGSNFYAPRRSVDEVYAAIFDDFERAFENLPSKGDLEKMSLLLDEKNAARKYVKYYADKMSALAALAHSSLTYANYLSLESRDGEARVYYKKAYDYASLVIDNGSYSLSGDFAGLYDYQKRETARQEVMFKATFIGDDLMEGFVLSGIYLPNTCNYSSTKTRQVLLMPWYVEQFSEDASMYDHSLTEENPLKRDARFSANFINRWLFAGTDAGNQGKTLVVFPDKGGIPVNILANPAAPQAVINDTQAAYKGFPMIGLYRDPYGGSTVTRLNGDYPILRLGEMYLIQAEAMNEMSTYNVEEILEPINTLRDRARKITGGVLPKNVDQTYLDTYMQSLPPAGIATAVGSVTLPETDKKYALRRLILKERDIELLGENRRYYDLKRMRAKDRNGKPRTMFEFLFAEYYPSLRASAFGTTCQATITTVENGGATTWSPVRYTPEPLMLAMDNGSVKLQIDPEGVKKYLLLPVPFNEIQYNTAIQGDQNWNW